MAARIRVLVVDDSAFARKVVREVLSRSPHIEVVGIARDGLDALEKMIELKPDVVTLDLVMPGLDGLGVLRAMPTPGPRVIVVTISANESELAVAALQAGAFDVVHKPTSLATEQLYDMAAQLQTAVIAAGRAGSPAPAGGLAGGAGRADRAPPAARPRVVVMGASTGGPQALTRLLKALPASFPVPIALVVHMPHGFTSSFAKRLDTECALDVLEAYQGLELRPGLAVVARAGMHLKLEARGGGCFADLDVRPVTTQHTPAVDVLFESAAGAFGADVLAVILTGMGSDGLEGARAIHARGGLVLAEAESSCVVYGMPRCVVEADLAAAVVRLEGMAEAVLKRV
jgi:two-component system chemotaxis response regulator CheB